MKIRMFGNNVVRMPDIAFMMMSWIFVVRDMLMSPWSILDEFEVERGQTIVDYGCGPGSYLKCASEMVGPEGMVWAVDVHELAIKAVLKRIDRENLSNVRVLQAKGNNSGLPDETADVIYALDMFHMVRDHNEFLKELNRICKERGLLYIGISHQSWEAVIPKIIASGKWDIVEKRKGYLKCRPVKN
ncbi:MAG TPA: class I SAM-dependent methyltransferase [Desulfobacteraceae bacterium]|nr:class I SAM-dependent methyltransferase [Desulfobacteraceae bacterium]HPJ67764.1 class I SAM-dependent methyltransferase [Desulfobacteraceae bacterium]HPQ28834.1 class I SAM-dependent methyltransferase [Desulfobacteraceae bacterium]